MLSVPLDRTRGGEILHGPRAWKLDQFALFDKVINLKLIRRSGDSFCIRSDYEVAYTRGGQPYFIPIRQKPHIHVQYKQVANETVTDVSVRITNLFIVNEDVGNDIFAQTGDPIVRMEIQMGYRGQFPDWTQPPLAFDTETSAEGADNRLRMFYNMDTFTIRGAQEEMDAGIRISAQVLACFPERLPPDRVIFIQGIVGTLDSGLRWQRSGERALVIADHLAIPSNFPAPQEGAEDFTTIEKLLFFYVTRRFFRNKGFSYQINIDEENPDAPATVRVLNYDAANSRFRTERDFLELPVAERWSANLALVDGLLSVDDALQLGVICSVSDGLKALSRANRLPRSTPTGGTITDSLERVPSVPFQTHLGAQIREIEEAFADIRSYQMLDGNLFFYAVRENINQVITSAEVQRADRNRRPILLPAVYDISIGGTRTIRCPFIGFLSTMQLIGFRAKYNIGSLVGYFYPKPENSWFRSILSDVTFDTTGDQNMMTIMCVDVPPPPEDTVMAPEEPEEQAATERRTRTTIRRILEWASVGVGTWVSWENATRTLVPDTWSRLIEVYVLHNDSIRQVQDAGVPERTAGIAEGFRFLMTNEQNKASNENWFRTRGPAEFVDTWPNLAAQNPGRLMRGDMLLIPTVVEVVEEEQV